MLPKCILLILSFIANRQEQNINIYLASSNNHIDYEEVINVDSIILDSILISSFEILAYSASDFSFFITDTTALRLKSMNLDFKIFCITSNERRILAGIFWPDKLSLGMDGFVSFNPGYGYRANEISKFHIGYCLPSKEIQFWNDPRYDKDLLKLE